MGIRTYDEMTVPERMLILVVELQKVEADIQDIQNGMKSLFESPLYPAEVIEKEQLQAIILEKLDTVLNRIPSIMGEQKKLSNTYLG